MVPNGRGGFAWYPDPDVVEASNLNAFIRAAGLPSYDALAAKADAEPAWFWEQVLTFFDVRFYRPYHTLMDGSGGIEWTRWCVGGATNIVLNCLDRHRDTEVFDRNFIVWSGEDGSDVTITYRAFDAEVSKLAAALRKMGYGRGDVIGLYMPNIIETYVAYYAILKIGGVVMPLFSGFGAQALADRLELGGARLVIIADQTIRRGKTIDMKPTVDEAVAAVPSVRHVLVKRRGAGAAWQAGRDVDWDEAVAGMPTSTPTEEMDTEDPSVILFTSGTTGKPKGCVYTHVGFLAKMLVDGVLMTDFKPTDRYFWMADMGWVVGSYTAVVPAVMGGSLFIAEGAPDFPEVDRIWSIIDKYRVTYLGLAPTIVRQAMQYNTALVTRHDFSRLRICYTGGEPWADKPWMWLLENVCRNRVPICNGSGGTEVGGCILFCTVQHPLKPCSFSVAIPGMGADIVDDDGNPVGVGQVGELVMRNPSMCLTKGLWNDPERYIESYWSRFPGLWFHGDLCSRDEDGLWYVHGRSDDTLKIAGKRTGPAEIESFVMATGCVAEAAAIGLPHPVKGECLAVVCTPMPGEVAGEDLRRRLSDAIVDRLGRTYRPDFIYFVADLPKTRNMKIMRRAVRASLSGKSAGDTSALLNPESLDAIRALAAVPPVGT